MKAVFFAALIICSIAYAAQEKFVYNSKWNRDPFVPLVTTGGIYIGSWRTGGLAEELVLEGIVWDPEGEPLAIVNGNIVNIDFNFEIVFAEVFSFLLLLII